MSGYLTDTLGWLAGAFYVIVALSIVYLYFFKIVPMVIQTIKEWNIFVVVRVTIVLASLAFLIGCVAVITGDWIFSQVLDTLPRTRMAREIDRVSGSLVQLSVPGPIYSAGNGTSYRGSSGFGASGPDPMAPAGSTNNSTQPQQEEPVSFPLKENALELWMTQLQQRFNPTGRYSDNTNVMARRDIPEGVSCDVAAVSGMLNGWRLKGNEEWQMVCSLDGFRNSVKLTINGTAARGLTGGGYYSLENPYPVYGEGTWPEQSLDMSRPTIPASPTPENDGAVGAAGTPEAPATAANSVQVHEVQRGESLALIAQNYQLDVNSLVNANVQKYPQLSRNPNVIVVGWELTIPAQQ